MNLSTILQTLKDSDIDDWHKMPDQGPFHHWNVTSQHLGEGARTTDLEPVAHSSLAVYKPDIDISIAFGAIHRDEFNEPWTKNFPDKRASSEWVCLRYRGTVVYDWIVVLVDGARYAILLPSSETGSDGEPIYRISREDLPLAELFYELYESVGRGPGGVDTALRLAGVEIG